VVSPRKVIVRLSEEQRKTLTRIVRTGTHPAAMLRRAQVLLKADADGPDGWSDMRIGKALGCSFMTVRRVRQQFVVQGLDATLHRKRPTGRQYRKLDGEQEAQLIAAVACSPAPDGRARWTMKLLAERLVELEVVGSIDPATVCRTLQKTRSSPGSSSSGSSRRRRAPRSSPTWRTCSTSTPARPPARPGAAGRLRRRGRQAVDRRDACASRCRRGRGRRRSSTATTSVAALANLFMAFEPLSGTRHVEVERAQDQRRLRPLPPLGLSDDHSPDGGHGRAGLRQPEHAHAGGGAVRGVRAGRGAPPGQAVRVALHAQARQLAG